MGSGGMVSTAADMNRWFEALRAGKVLPADALTRYWSPPGSLLAAGDSYGFEIAYSEGAQARFILMSNATGFDQRPASSGLARRLLELVSKVPNPK